MKTVIEMAREAEFPAANYPALVSDGEWEALERFAELVRADAIADEREACAKWLEDEKDAPYWAELLRARSNT